MQISIKNSDLTIVMKVLEIISVRNMKANRGRAKLLKKVSEKMTEYLKEQDDILSEYVVMDGDYFARDGNGDMILKDPEQLGELNEMLGDLKNEAAVLDFGEYEERCRAFMDCLSHSDDAFSAEQIIVIDDILEQFEKGVGE